METPDLDPNRSAEVLAADIAAYILEAGRKLDAGEYVALEGLGASVEALCQRVLAQRADNVQHVLPHLEVLREQLDVLQQRIEEARVSVKGELDASSTRQKASRAYRPPEDKR